MKKCLVAACVLVITTVASVSSVAPTPSAKGLDVTSSSPYTGESLSTRVDKLFARWDRSDSPGCSLGISRNGSVVYERGYGLANVETQRPITPDSVFFVASISKQFTAMSIMLLAQRGMLSLDDEARKYIPDLPDYGTRLTIKHLLTHTSGLRDVFLLRELAAPRDDGPEQSEGMVRLLTHQRGLNFTPGSEYQYSNAGYVMLASVVRRVSGQPLPAFAEANIFKPLGMTQTHVHDDPKRLVPHRASGYSPDGASWRLALTGISPGSIGNAGVFTTPRDMLRWEQNFADPRVGDRALVSAMATTTTLTNGETSSYGYGLVVGQYRGLRTVEHGGGDPGYSAFAVRYPDQNFAVAVFCNRDDIDSAGLTQRIADIFLADAFTAPFTPLPTGPQPPLPLSAEQLAGKEGLYRNVSSQTLVRILVRDGQIRATGGAGTSNSTALAAVGGNRFIVPDTTTAIEFGAAVPGRAPELRLITAESKPETLQRVDPFTPSATEVRAFAGEYASRELEVTYTIAAGDSGLVMRIPGRAPIVLEPIFLDAFRAPGLVDVLQFSRDARGAVSGFAVHGSGVRDLRFDRVKP